MSLSLIQKPTMSSNVSPLQEKEVFEKLDPKAL